MFLSLIKKIPAEVYLERSRKAGNIMARILTGIQSTGTPHLGNILGALMPAIKMANSPENESFLFIANLHTITQIK